MQLSHGAPRLADGPLYDVSSLRQAWSLGVRDCSCFEARVTTRVTSERLRETPVVACCRARGINIPPDITKESPATAACLGAVPLNGISMEFGNQTNFIMLLFIKYSVDHNETYHGVCKISMWSFIHILNQTISNFEYYSTEIPLVGRAHWMAILLKVTASHDAACCRVKKIKLNYARWSMRIPHKLSPSPTNWSRYYISSPMETSYLCIVQVLEWSASILIFSKSSSLGMVSVMGMVYRKGASQLVAIKFLSFATWQC